MKASRARRGSRKYGRMKDNCELYQLRNRREKNKIRRLTHLIDNGHHNNLQLISCIRRLDKAISQ